MNTLCKAIDDAPPNSRRGKLIEMLYRIVITALKTPEKVKEFCAASETCTAGTDAFVDAANTVVQTATDATNVLKEQCAASDYCTAGREKVYEMFDNASQSASSLWSATKRWGQWYGETSTETCTADKDMANAAKDMAAETQPK